LPGAGGGGGPWCRGGGGGGGGGGAGTLEPGKRADVVVWNAKDYREIPYWFGANLASRVFRAGRS
jgi:imidazolonepropionase-like amidohydrolase